MLRGTAPDYWSHVLKEGHLTIWGHWQWWWRWWWRWRWWWWGWWQRWRLQCKMTMNRKLTFQFSISFKIGIGWCFSVRENFEGFLGSNILVSSLDGIFLRKGDKSWDRWQIGLWCESVIILTKASSFSHTHHLTTPQRKCTNALKLTLQFTNLLQWCGVELALDTKTSCNCRCTNAKCSTSNWTRSSVVNNHTMQWCSAMLTLHIKTVPHLCNIHGVSPRCT